MSYDINKTYEGVIKNVYPVKKFGFIKTHDIGDVFFHFTRFATPPNTIKISDAVSFKLIYSKKNPGRVAATELVLVKSTFRQEIIKLEQIETDEQFVKLCKILDAAKKEDEYEELSTIAYQNSSPLYKLRLWIKKYVKNFDFELFKKYHFRLHRQEAAEFKRYVKENIKESKRNDFRVLGVSNLIEQQENGTKIYETSWRDIGFENRKIFINIGNNESKLLSFNWGFSRDDFNLIVTGYIARKDLKSIKCSVVEDNITEVEGLDQLQEAIRTIERTKAKKTIDELIKEGWSPKQIREHPEFVTLSNENLLRLFGNHDCIDYLQKIQSTSMDTPLIYIVEKRPNSTTGGISFESSYLFTIILENKRIAIIWESVKLDRATQVFVCNEEEYFELIKDIDDFLSSLETKKRSTLKSNTDEGRLLREKLKYRTTVEHTEYNFEKWLRNLKRAIPELNNVTSK